MKKLDTLCAGILFTAGMVDGLSVPKNYSGRIWIFGTCLALLFTAMLNLVRIRNDAAVHHLRSVCVVANLSMLAFAIALMASIGESRTLQHPQIPAIASLLLGESAFSLGR